MLLVSLYVIGFIGWFNNDADLFFDNFFYGFLCYILGLIYFVGIYCLGFYYFCGWFVIIGLSEKNYFLYFYYFYTNYFFICETDFVFLDSLLIFL